MAEPPDASKRRLHIGCGVQLIPGFVNMDADASIPGVDETGSVEDLSRFADGQFDEIYLSHVLEHVPYAEVPRALAGLHRILNPGGTLRIAVPDLDRICRLYVENIDWFAPPHSPWLGLFYGGQVNDYDFHKGGFNFRYLEGLLRAAGFESVTEVPPTEAFGIRDGSFSNRPFGLVSLSVTATRCAGQPVGACFRHTAPERALLAAERALEIALRAIVRMRLALIRRRRAASGNA
jgi:SAM-dependent methyltransferase